MKRNLTRKQAAEQLNVSPRWLSDRVRDLGIPILRAGHRMLFDEGAMARIEDSMRTPKRSSRLQPRIAPRSGLFAVQSSGSTWKEALALALEGKRPSSSRAGAKEAKRRSIIAEAPSSG